MNKQIPVTNDGDSPRWVSGVMIPPGETRHFDESALPPELRGDVAAEEPAAAGADPLRELSLLSVSKLALGLAALSDDELIALEALEHEKDKPRQGALAEIAAERLRRAESSVPGGEATDETDPLTAGDAGDA